MPTEIKPVEQSLKPEYLSEDEIKVIIGVFGQLDMNLESAKLILPINKKLENVLKEPTLEPDKKIQIGYKKVELEKP